MKEVGIAFGIAFVATVMSALIIMAYQLATHDHEPAQPSLGSGIPAPPAPDETAPCIDKFPVQVNRPVGFWIRDQASDERQDPPYRLEERFGYTQSDRYISAVVYRLLTASEELPTDPTLQELGEDRVTVVAYVPCSYTAYLEGTVGGTRGPVIQGQGVERLERAVRAILTDSWRRE